MGKVSVAIRNCPVVANNAQSGAGGAPSRANLVHSYLPR